MSLDGHFVGDDGFVVSGDLGHSQRRFRKSSFRHRPGIYRRIPFTGESKWTSAKRRAKFVTLVTAPR